MPVAAILPLITTAAGLYNSAQQKRKQDEADKLARASIANRPEYQVSDASKNYLADTQGRLDATSPGVIAAQRQIQQGAANQMGFAERNASSGAQALAVGAGAQSLAQSAYPQLAQQQDNYAQQNRGQYYQALQGMDEQNQRQFESRTNKYSDLTNFYLGQVGAANANRGQSLSLAATGLASFASAFGGNGTNPNQSTFGSYLRKAPRSLESMGTVQPDFRVQTPPMNYGNDLANAQLTAPQQQNSFNPGWSYQDNPLLSSYSGYNRMY